MDHINYFIDWALYDIRFKILALFFPISCIIPNRRQGLFVKNDFEIRGHMFLTIFNMIENIFLSGYYDLYFNIGGALRPYTYHQPTSHEERIHSRLRFVDRLYPTTYIVTWPKIRIFKFLVLIKQFAIGKNFFDQKSYWNLRLRKNHKLRFAIFNRMDQFIQLLLRRRGAILTKYLQKLEAYA